MNAAEITKEKRTRWKKIIDRYKHLSMTNPLVKSLRGLAQEVERLDTELRRAYKETNRLRAAQEKLVEARVDMRIAEKVRAINI